MFNLSKKINKMLINFLKFDTFKIEEDFIFFINGKVDLPKPLEKEKEFELISKLDTGDEEVKGKLIEHNLRLVVYIAKKFENTKLDMEDLISIGSVGLIKAVNSFKADKNIKLATYASRCIENEILMYLRKSAKLKKQTSLNETLSSDNEGNSLSLIDILGTDEEECFKEIESDAEKKIMWSAIEKLGEREKEIMLLRFGLAGKEEKTQKEVADMMGISQSYISRLEKKIVGRLKKEMNKLM